jgi:hypothetical protein
MNATKKRSHQRNKQRLRLPCLAPTGTKIFVPTADQRLLTGDHTQFLRTHFPIQLQSRRTGSMSIVTEQDLLDQLLTPSAPVVGNRVMILYGAAGSGKSELLRWLQTQITMRDATRADVMTRISRTDLDVFHIVQRIQQHYNTPTFQTATQRRWDECRQKPRTLAKLLVLTSLEQILRSDEQINALYYQLIDVIQTNLERCFAAMSQPTEDMGSFIELFSREDLKEILRTSVIPVPIEYEALRFHILKTFKDQLLEGIDLPYLLRQIADHTQQRGLRPILFIDDLVQSINLFATDLLDYFITLEEGCWDIIVGITPSSLEATLRGKELLERINFLDTIDDRVQKLWLSDESGLSSSFLNETNCAEFARLYLSEYKRQNKRACDSSCPAFHRCNNLEPDRSDNLLAPFNEEILIRLFRSLPEGKGKVRYFTLYLRDILEKIAQGEDVLTVLQRYVRSELAVYHSNKRLALIHELYGPFSRDGETMEGDQQISRILQFFSVQELVESMEMPVIVRLHKSHVSEQQVQSTSDTSLVLDPGKEAIKLWLQGDIVNKQQLRNLRRGAVKAIKDGYLLDTMTRLDIAKPSRVLHWTQTRLETIPPVSLEGVDDFEGLAISRAIGPLAYLLHDFADASGWAERDLRDQILQHPNFPTLLFRAREYRKHIRNELEKQLGMTVEDLAFALFIVATRFHQIAINLPPSLEEKMIKIPVLSPKYPESLEEERPRLTMYHQEMIRRLFDDCFKLRENIYDGLLLESMVEAISPEQAVELLQKIDVDKLSADFRLNEQPLSVLLSAVQHEIASLTQLRTNYKAKASLTLICKAGLKAEDASQQLVNLLDLADDIELSVEKFLQRCSPLELHRALSLAYLVDVAQYEDSVNRLRQALLELEEEMIQIPPSDVAWSLTKNFAKNELEVLVGFTQKDFRVPISQIEARFLTKVADHLPNLYRRLEIRHQRG